MTTVWKRVLVVDDDAELRGLVADVLERNGYDVVSVDSGADAVAYLRTDRPSVILLDLRMPDVDGWQVLGYLKKDDRCVRCLPKPFGVDGLLSAISDATR